MREREFDAPRARWQSRGSWKMLFFMFLYREYVGCMHRHEISVVNWTTSVAHARAATRRSANIARERERVKKMSKNKNNEETKIARRRKKERDKKCRCCFADGSLESSFLLRAHLRFADHTDTRAFTHLWQKVIRWSGPLSWCFCTRPCPDVRIPFWPIRIILDIHIIYIFTTFILWMHLMQSRKEIISSIMEPPTIDPCQTRFYLFAPNFYSHPHYRSLFMISINPRTV